MGGMKDRAAPARSYLAILIGSVFLLGATSARVTPQIITLPTRPGVTMRVLLMGPRGTPPAILVMFPGGRGKGHFGEKDGTVRLGGNFLVRTSPLFEEEGFAVAVIDTPSDRPNGMFDDWRIGHEHSTDVTTLLDFLSSRSAGIPIVLVGTSRGTLSAAHLATASDPRVTRLVLASAMSQPPQWWRWRGRWKLLSDLPLQDITVPVLFVQHRDDVCNATGLDATRRLTMRFRRSPHIDFIEVRGGDPRKSKPCQGLSAHGFLGKEREVVAAISAWIQGRPVPQVIGP